MTDTFETWAEGVIYNDQPLPERKGVPYFLAQKAYNAGVAEGIRMALDEVRMLPCWGTREAGFEFEDDVTRDDVLEAIDALREQP